MARTLVGTTRINIGLTYADSADLSTTQAPISQEIKQAWTSGSGSNQANREYDDTLTLAVSTPQTLDLYGGLTDRFGNTLNFVTIREIIIVNKSTALTAEPLEISGDFITGAVMADWVDDAVKISIGRGGVFHVKDPSDGWAVTSGSVEDITLDPAAKTFDVDIYILGTE